MMMALALTIVMSAAVGCSPKAPATPNAETPAGTEEGKKDITIVYNSEPSSMDPHDTNDTIAYSLQKLMLEGLFSFDKDMKVIPVLAESYTANDTATEFTIKLKTGIKFHDGTDFNAEAVKVNLDRLADQTQKLKRNSLFSMIEKNEVVDASTIKVTLKTPFGAFINTLAHPAGMIISPKALAEYGKEVSKHPVGTGAYVFKEWTPGTKFMTVKNAEYWGTEPQYNSISFKTVKEDGSRVAMLQTGEADFIYPVPSMQIETLQNDKNVKILKNESIIVRYISMNVNKKPFDDVRVRQALNYALDKNAFSQVVFNGDTTPLNSVIAPNTQFYAEQKAYDYNIEKAKQLLTEAGYPNGFSTKIWSNNSSASVKADEFIQQQLAKVGIMVEVVPMEAATLSEKVYNAPAGSGGEVELYYGGWSPSTGDADWGIRPLLATESAPPASYNTAYYSNPEVDQLIQDALHTSDPAARAEAYAKIQEIIWNDAPWVFLSVDDNMAAAGSTITGINLLPDGSLQVAPEK